MFLDEARIAGAKQRGLCGAARGGKGPCGHRFSWKPDICVNIKIYTIKRYYIYYVNICYIYMVITQKMEDIIFSPYYNTYIFEVFFKTGASMLCPVG